MSLISKPTKPITVFISYSREDQNLRDQLETHLSLLHRQGLISSWHDRKVGAGEDWAGQIDTYLNTAHIILLLISSDFMASNYCYNTEMMRALARHEAAEARVIPVILRPADWKSVQLGKLQALPRNAKAVTTWKNQDEAFLDITMGIRDIVENKSVKSEIAPYHLSTHRSILGFPPPTDPKTIQQREEIVKDVYVRLAQPDITAIVLTGLGGLGKSTLAALIYRYAEAQRYAGFGPFLAEALWLTIDPTVTVVDLAITLFEALGKPIPDFSSLSSHNQALALFNALNMVDEARLIILDQFENLLNWQTGNALTDRPGVGEWLDIINSQKCTCRILLTSRPQPQGAHEYPPTYMQECPVQSLGTSEGSSLLRKQGVGLAQATEADLQLAVKRCEGHALALTLLASILRGNRSLSLNSLFQNPIYASLWTGNIARSLLDYIYIYQLSDEQRKLLRAFSIYREPVPLEAAYALIAEIPHAQLLNTLNVLLTQHLLNAVGEGCYRLHMIVASYAQAHFVEGDALANQQTSQAMHRQAAQYYLQQAANKCPPRGKRRTINDVQPLIEATWQYCQAEMWRSAWNLIQREEIFSDLKRWGGNAILLELYRLLLPIDKWHPELLQKAHICSHLGEIYSALGQKERALNYYEEALNIYKESEDRESEGRVLSGLGNIYSTLGQKEHAQEYYKEASNIYASLGDRRGEATMLHNLGGVYDDMGQKEKAQQCYERALTIFKEIGDDKRGARTLSNLSLVYSALGQHVEAQKCCKQALRIFQGIGDLEGEGEALNNLGLVYKALGHNKEALNSLEQALRISRVAGDRWKEGRVLGALGRVYHMQGQNKEAQKYYEQAINMTKEVGDCWEEGRTMNDLGQIYDEAWQVEEAQKCYEQALSLSKEVGDREGEGRSSENLGRVYGGLGQKDEAQECFEQALIIFREIKDRAAEGRTLNNLGLIYDGLGQKEEALEYYRQALQISKETKDRTIEGKVLGNLGLIYDGLGQKEEARKYYRQALQISKETKDRNVEGNMLNNLGSICSTLGQKKEARKYFEQALRINKEVGNRYGEGRALSNLGVVCNELGQKDQARAYFEQAFALFKEIRDYDSRGMTLYQLGMLYFRQQSYHIALACFLLARSILDEMKSPNIDKTIYSIEEMRKEVGDVQFGVLLSNVEAQIHQIVEQALHGEA